MKINAKTARRLESLCLELASEPELAEVAELATGDQQREARRLLLERSRELAHRAGATCPTTNGADLDRWEVLQADRRALLEALRDVELRTAQARIASTIGKRAGKEDFLRNELERIGNSARAAIEQAEHQDNAGCDRCGINDRVPSLTLCEACANEEAS